MQGVQMSYQALSPTMHVAVTFVRSDHMPLEISSKLSVILVGEVELSSSPVKYRAIVIPFVAVNDTSSIVDQICDRDSRLALTCCECESESGY